jgi:ribonuclease D
LRVQFTTMFKATIEKEDLRSLPLEAFQGEIHVIDTSAGVKKYLPILLKENLLGFDTETRPAFKKGQKNTVALLQFSTEFHAFLFRISSVGLPDQLIHLLENEDIKKIGAAVHDDIIELKAVREFKQEGFFDLQKYVEAFGIENKAVAKMAGIVLGFRISKSQQLSNWDAEVLSEPQKLYAATDAWACYKIYSELQNYRLK